MIIVEEAKSRTEELIKQYWQMAVDRFQNNRTALRYLGCPPEFCFNKMKDNVGGRCHYLGDWIEINTRFFPTNDIRFIEVVVRHEVGHAIAHRVYKVTGHGKKFHEVMEWLGGEKSRFVPGWINDPVPVQGSGRVKCVCKKCGRIHYVTQRMAKEIQEQQSLRFCVNCHEALSF